MSIKSYAVKTIKNSLLTRIPVRTGKVVTATELVNNYIKRVEKEKALFLNKKGVAV